MSGMKIRPAERCQPSLGTKRSKDATADGNATTTRAVDAELNAACNAGSIGRVYASWPAGSDRALIMCLTIRNGESVVEFRYVERGLNGRLMPANRFFAFRMDQLDALCDAAKNARADAKRWQLVPEEKQKPQRTPAKRWSTR
jgi:hypothetical protein